MFDEIEKEIEREEKLKEFEEESRIVLAFLKGLGAHKIQREIEELKYEKIRRRALGKQLDRF